MKNQVIIQYQAMDTRVFRSIISSVLLLYGACFSLPIYAEEPATFQDGIKAVGDLANTNKLAPAKSTKEILQTIVKWLLSLTGTVAVISLLYGGFLYITSQGEENKAEQAKNIILYSVIGIIIIGISAVVVNVVINIATQ